MAASHPLPAGTPLSDFVDAPPALARRLSQTAVVTREEGQAAQEKLQPGQRLVTQRGDLWRWDGYAASADAKTPAAIRLEQRNRLAVLEQELAAAKALRYAVEQELSSAHQKTSAVQESSRGAQQRLREAQSALAEAQDHAARMALRSAEGAGQIATLEAKLRALEDRRVTALNGVQAAEEALAVLGDGTNLSAALDEAKQKAAEARATEAEARARLQQLRPESRVRSDRLTAVAREILQWTARAAAAAAQGETLAGRISAMTCGTAGCRAGAG